jgi:hypothetical protein
LLSDLADEVGLIAELSAAIAPTNKRRRGHDRGRMLTDLAVSLVDGATSRSRSGRLGHRHRQRVIDADAGK